MEKQGFKLFLIFFFCSVALLLWLFWSFVSAIVLALLITSVTYPLYQWTKSIFRGNETLSALVMVFFLFLVLMIPMSWFVGTLSSEAFNFYEQSRSAVSLKHIQEILGSDHVWIQRIKKAGALIGADFSTETVEELARSVGRVVGLFLYKQLSSIASNFFKLLLHFFLMMMVMYYLFRDGVRLKDYLIQLIPVPERQQERVAEKFNEMGRAIFLGNGFSGLIQGFLGGLGFFLFGLQAPFLWGTVIAVMAFVPIIGASFVFVPATVILMIQGKFGTGFAYFLYNMVYSGFIEYLVKPRLLGKGMQMNSLLVFIGIIGGIKIFGILGIIYGPLIITIFLTLAEIYRLEYKERPA